MDKKELRDRIRAEKRQLAQDDLRRLSLSVINRLAGHPRFVAARTVMLYHSLTDEVDTRLLLNEIRDKLVLLPKVTGEGTMELRVYTGPGDLRVGAYGIMEPVGRLFTDYSDIDLAAFAQEQGVDQCLVINYPMMLNSDGYTGLLEKLVK